MIKSSNNGPFVIPAAPSAGTAVAQSASANTFGTVTQMIASTAEADYIIGVTIEATTTQVPTYLCVQFYTGAGNTVVGTVTIPIPFTAGAAATQIGLHFLLPFPIPVATATKISVATASSAASAISWNVWLIMHKQADLIDAGVKEQADVQTWLASAVTAATAGVPDVNVKNYGNFTAGVGAISSLPKVDMEYIADSLVSSTTAQLGVNVVKINNVVAATPGASGGVLISGSNAGTTTFNALTVTNAFNVNGTTGLAGNVALSAGLNITQSTTNGSAIVLNGNGNGHGIVVAGGLTGNGLNISGGGTSGNGIRILTSSGDGVFIAPTAGHGFNVAANGTAKDALHLVGSAAATTNAGGHAINAVGGAASTGAGGTAGNGIKAAGGAGAASTNGAAVGVSFTGGGTNTVASVASGLQVTGTSTGHGLDCQSGAGATGRGINAVANSTNDAGVSAAGAGTGDGMTLTGGASAGGDGLACAAGGGVDIRGNRTGDLTGTVATVTAVTNRVTANADQISGSAAAAANLAAAYAAFETGTAAAGGTSTITLRAGASATNDYYKDQVVFILSGTGAGQTNRVSSYVGATKVATVETSWVVQPDATSTYLVLGRVG